MSGLHQILGVLPLGAFVRSVGVSWGGIHVQSFFVGLRSPWGFNYLSKSLYERQPDLKWSRAETGVATYDCQFRSPLTRVDLLINYPTSPNKTWVNINIYPHKWLSFLFLKSNIFLTVFSTGRMDIIVSTLSNSFIDFVDYYTVLVYVLSLLHKETFSVLVIGYT